MALLRALVVVPFLLVASSAAALPRLTFEGHAYVELDRVAASLRTVLDATPGSTRAYLRTPGHVVTFTRNWSQIIVDGAPMVLEAPVRVRGGVWLVPEMFVARVLPRLGALPAPPAPRPPLPAPASLEELRVRSYPSFTRVVLETSGPVSHRLERGTSGEVRVIVPNLGAAPRVEEVRDGFVGEVRVERAGAAAVLRVSFDVPPADARAKTLADPHRLVLEFARPAAPGERGNVAGPLRAIVLDAGHGGHDPGAVGPGGLQEKDLVLDVTRRVARLVEDRLAIKVMLSRAGDYFVPLQERTSFANKQGADLFVSIHANAHREAASAGVETYFLSEEATDSQARQVAALENSVIQLEKPVAARGRLDPVRAILWDLAQSEFQAESSRLAEVVQDSMTQSLRIPNRGVKQAGFYVLGGAAMPAILIEIGFVTNPREERRLKDSRYRDEIAHAIFAGIAEYRRHWDQRMRADAPRPR